MVKWKFINLRNTSFGNGHENPESYDARFEIFKATMLKKKATMSRLPRTNRFDVF